MVHFPRPAPLILVALIIATAAEPAFAQTGRVSGIVRDEDGQPVRGATVTADNPDLGAVTFTATTDDRGRFTIIGLRPGEWRFVAEAPNHIPEGGRMPVRADSRMNAAMTFTLRKAAAIAGPLGNVVAADLQAGLAAADALFNAERWDDAIAAYRALLAKAPALTIVNLQIGAAYRGKQDFEAAISAYRELLKIDEDNGPAHVGIALATLEGGNPAAAEAVLRPMAEGPEARRDVLFTLGEIGTAQGRTADAEAWYRRSAEADPSWGKPRYRLAEVALERGDTAAAAKLLDEVIAVDPVSAEAGLAKAALDRLNR